MLVDVVCVVIGLGVLAFSGEFALRGAVNLAKYLHVSPALIGLTVIGFGTSAPELIVTLQAALQGRPDLAIGNIIGSNISNITLILGTAGMIFPLICQKKEAITHLSMLFFAISIFIILTFNHQILAWHGVLMLSSLLVFLGYSYKVDRDHYRKMALENAGPIHDTGQDGSDDFGKFNARYLMVTLLTLTAGIAGLIGGAHLLVEGAVGIAIFFNIPETIIGLTMVALGTSLPEMASTIVAALRRHTDVAVANIIGSCLFNILFILGLTAVITPLPIAKEFMQIDIWVMSVAAVILVPMIFRNFQIDRIEALILFLGYCAYIFHIGLRVFV